MRPTFLTIFDTMKIGQAWAIPSFSHGPHSKQEDLSYSFLTSWRGGFIYLCCTVVKVLFQDPQHGVLRVFYYWSVSIYLSGCPVPHFKPCDWSTQFSE